VVRTLGVAIGTTLVCAVIVLAGSLPATAARTRLPDIDAPPLRAIDPHLTDQWVRGRPTVLLFWASWCEPCQLEIPAIARAIEAHAAAGTNVVGIDTNDRKGDAIAFLTAHGATALPTAFDDTGTVAEALHLYGLPSAVYVHANGDIVASRVGPITVQDIVRFADQAGDRR
jgi:thiol-disulfide isomerase/thioredoxin